MPEPGRSLLILRDIQELDVATVARTLALSENQVKVYTFRARRRLRQRLEEDMHARQVA
jgi:RNA polymerase sigma-70 factor (ECF subfamily)